MCKALAFAWLLVKVQGNIVWLYPYVVSVIWSVQITWLINNKINKQANQLQSSLSVSNMFTDKR